MREQILEYVAAHPNCRARSVASHLHQWGPEVSIEMHRMANEGLLKSTYHHDAAQMEFYDTYELPD
jgi:Mn-dependent DtxR family transcriptional regulator